MSQLLMPPADGSNSKDMILNELSRNGVVRLGPGRFVWEGKTTRWDCIQLQGRKAIIGSGPSTVLAFQGEGRSPSPTGVMGGDWRGISITGDDNYVADLTIDTSALVNTEEQTHVMHISGPARHTTIRNVWFYHPIRRDLNGVVLPGGDCIKIGSWDPEFTSTIIEGCHFIQCDRSGIASIGGFEALVVKGCIFYDTGDQDFDTEGTAGTGGNLILDGNIHLTARGGGYAAQVALKDGVNIHVKGCIFDGRGLFIGGGRRVTIEGTTIVQRQSGAPTLDLVKNNDDVKIDGCTIIRTSTALPNMAVKIQHHHSGKPGAVQIINSTIRNETSSPVAASIQSARSVQFANNSFEWRPVTVPAGTTHTMVGVQSIAQRCEMMTMSGCTFVGPANRSLQFNDKDFGMGLVTLIGNTASMPIFVQRVTRNEAGEFVPFGPVVSAGNNWPAPLGGFTEFGTGR